MFMNPEEVGMPNNENKKKEKGKKLKQRKVDKTTWERKMKYLALDMITLLSPNNASLFASDKW
jgi:hypothetical protein